jgi:hypothetical protein
MKTFLKSCPFAVCLVLFFFMMSLSVSSQEVIEVKNIKALMSKGTQTCYLVEIPQADLKIVQQNWIKKLQEGTKIKVKVINQELLLPGVVKIELSPDTANIYSLLIQKENRIVLNVFVEFDSVFFEPKEDKTDLANDKIDNSVKNYVRSFAVDQYKLAVGNDLEGEQKVLETMQDDLKKLEKDNENMVKDISSLENDIDKTEREVKDIESNINLKNKEILENNVSMATIVLEADKKAAQEKQKGLEKEKNKLEKERSKAKDDISSCKSKIDKNNKDIKDNEEQQEAKKEEITSQTEVVSKVQTKLDGIK